MALGPLAFLGSLPLWIVLPVLLVLLGVGIYLTIQLLPFIVSGLVMILFYLVFDYILDVETNWKYYGSIILGLVALVPFMFPSLRGAVAGNLSGMVSPSALGVTSQASAQLGLQSILDSLASAPMWIVAFVILIFLGIGLKSLSDLGSPGAFIAGGVGIALSIIIITNVFGGVVPLAGAGGDGVFTSVDGLSGDFSTKDPDGYVRDKAFVVWDARLADQGHTEHKGMLSQAQVQSVQTSKDKSGGMVTYNAEVDYVMKFRLYEMESGLRDPNLESLSADVIWRPLDSYWSLEEAKVESGIFGSGGTDMSYSLYGPTGNSFTVNVVGNGEHEDDTVSLKVTTVASATVSEGQSRPFTVPTGGGGVDDYKSTLVIVGLVAIPALGVWFYERSNGPAVSYKKVPRGG